MSAGIPVMQDFIPETYNLLIDRFRKDVSNIIISYFVPNTYYENKEFMQLISKFFEEPPSCYQLSGPFFVYHFINSGLTECYNNILHSNIINKLYSFDTDFYKMICYALCVLHKPEYRDELRSHLKIDDMMLFNEIDIAIGLITKNKELCYKGATSIPYCRNITRFIGAIYDNSTNNTYLYNKDYKT